MAKVPVAGRVKTRLAREIGVGASMRFARHAIATTVTHVARQGPWQTVLAIAPDGELAKPLRPPGVALIAQGRGDLGERMQRIMDRAPLGPVVLIGTDIPGISAAHIREAFRLLGRHDAVVGPATDGGYWLIGLRRRPRVLRPFHGVRWSSPHALSDTLANLEGCSVARVATLGDVDSAEDLVRDARLVGRRVASRQI